MNHHYADIVDRIDEEPRWWDEHAVPRYCEPGPDESADIYAQEVALVGIECQGCGEQFRVMFSYSIWPDRKPLSERIPGIHYGDPPNAGCCASGPTMNSVPKKVLRFWRRGHETGHRWERDESLEVDLTPPWALEAPHE